MMNPEITKNRSTLAAPILKYGMKSGMASWAEKYSWM